MRSTIKSLLTFYYLFRVMGGFVLESDTQGDRRHFSKIGLLEKLYKNTISAILVFVSSRNEDTTAYSDILVFNKQIELEYKFYTDQTVYCLSRT